MKMLSALLPCRSQKEGLSAGRRLASICIGLILFMANAGISPLYAADRKPTIDFITEARYDNSAVFSEVLALVTINHRAYYIDETGKVVIDMAQKIEAGAFPGYTMQNLSHIFYGHFHNGLAYISYDPQSGLLEKAKVYYFDTKGNTVLSAPAPFDFSEGYVYLYPESIDPSASYNDIRFMAKDQSTLALTDLFQQKNKGLLVSGSYYSGFHDGLYALSVRFQGDTTEARKATAAAYGIAYDENVSRPWDYWVYANRAGEIVLFKDYLFVHPFYEGRALVDTKDGHCGIIDKTGAFITQSVYSDFYVNDVPYSFRVYNEGVAWAENNDDIVMLDETGQVITWFPKSRYTVEAFLKNGYVAVSNNQKLYGYLNAKGQLAIPCQFSDYSYFNEGYALVSNGNLYRFIDEKGLNVTDERWQFDLIYMDYDHPDHFFYQSGGKWGLARISYDGTKIGIPTPEAVDSFIKIVHNGTPVVLDLPTVNRDGRTYYPFRQLIEALGGEVSWNDSLKAATAQIGGSRLTYFPGGDIYQLNDQNQTITDGLLPFIDQASGRTYVSIRQACEILGFSVVWDAPSNTIAITPKSNEIV